MGAVDRKAPFYSSAGFRSRLAAVGAFHPVWDGTATWGDGSHVRKGVVRFKEEACTALATRARVPCGNACSARAGSFARRVAFSAPWKSAQSSGSSSAVTRTTDLPASTATPVDTTISSRSLARHAISVRTVIRSACLCMVSGSRRTFSRQCLIGSMSLPCLACIIHESCGRVHFGR